jgi:hypothetical protein
MASPLLSVLTSGMPAYSDTRKGRMQGNLSAGLTSPSTLVRGLTQVYARVIDRLSMSQQIVEFTHRLDSVAGET